MSRIKSRPSSPRTFVRKSDRELRRQCADNDWRSCKRDMRSPRLASADRIAAEFVPGNPLQGSGFVAVPQADWTGGRVTASLTACGAFMRSNTSSGNEKATSRRRSDVFRSDVLCTSCVRWMISHASVVRLKQRDERKSRGREFGDWSRIVGLAIARELARSGRSVFVLEAGSHVGCGISSRNSEVIYSGIYYPTNSLKHLFVRRGTPLALCLLRESRRRLSQMRKNSGRRRRLEAEELVAIARRAAQNNVENVETLDAPAAKRLEPAVRAVSALHVKETGIIDSHGFMLSLVGEIEHSGGAVMLNHRVLSGRPSRAHRYELDVASPSGV